MYNLNLIRQIDDMLDYDILFDNTKIGSLNITDREDSVFIRHINILPEHRRHGHARNVLDEIFDSFEKDICFCIATNSDSAVQFWNRILKERGFEHIRGNIYRVHKSTLQNQRFLNP